MASPDTRLPIGAVLVDVHGTLVCPLLSGKTDHVAQVILKVTGYRVDGRRARLITNVIRRELNQSRLEEYLNSDKYWIEVNRGMMQRGFNLKISDALALEIHNRLVQGEYTMHPKRRVFVNWLLKTKFGKTPHVVVASNSREDEVQRILSAEAVSNLFDDVFTSERLHVSKPAPSFWTKVLKSIGVAPHETLMVGNSLLNDAVAARHGIHTVLILDRYDDAEEQRRRRSVLEEHAMAYGGDVRWRATQHLVRIRDFIEENFRAAT